MKRGVIRIPNSKYNGKTFTRLSSYRNAQLGPASIILLDIPFIDEENIIILSNSCLEFIPDTET